MVMFLDLCHSCKLAAGQCRMIHAISRPPSLGCMTRRLNYSAEEKTYAGFFKKSERGDHLLLSAGEELGFR